MIRPHDDENPPSPQESLLLITQQQERTYQARTGDALAYWGPWGAAWLVGFGLFFLRQGLNGKPYVDMPENLPLIVLFVLMAVAMAMTIGVGARSSRDFQGPANQQGMMYGFTWFFGFISVVAVGVRFGDYLPAPEQSVLWSGMAVGMTGTLYLAGAALWKDKSMFVMGLWLTAVNAVGITLGPGWHPLLVSVAGGGGMLVGGTVRRYLSRKRMPV